MVAVGRTGIEHLERGELDALAPTGIDIEATDEASSSFKKDVLGIETGRQTRSTAVVAAWDEGDVLAQACRDLQRRAPPGGYGQTILHKEPEVVHRGLVAVAIGPPGGGIAHVVVIDSAARIVVVAVFGARLQRAGQLLSAGDPFISQLGVGRPWLAVAATLHIPVACRPEDDVCLGVGIIVLGYMIPLCSGMNIGLSGGAAGVVVIGVQPVRGTEGRSELQLSDERFVQQPFQREVSAEGVVAHFAVAVEVVVGVALGVVATDIGTQTHVEGQRRALSEPCVRIVQREGIALIGRMR